MNFWWYKCDNQKDIEQLFISVNFDSTKNQNFIQSDAFDKIKITEFTTSDVELIATGSTAKLKGTLEEKSSVDNITFPPASAFSDTFGNTLPFCISGANS